MADHEMKAPLELDDGAPQVVVTQPLMVQQPPITYKMDDLVPHSFMGFAVVVAGICGFFLFPTLFCSIPAIVLAVIVSFQCANEVSEIFKYFRA